MRIVTTGASEPVTAAALAGAFQQRFPLARGAASRTRLTAIFEIDRLVKEIVAWPKRIQSLPSLHNSNFSLEMAFQANGVTVNRIELRRIDDRSPPTFSHMARCISVTRCAGDSSSRKGRARKMVACVWQRLLYVARVAM